MTKLRLLSGLRTSVHFNSVLGLKGPNTLIAYFFFYNFREIIVFNIKPIVTHDISINGFSFVLSTEQIAVLTMYLVYIVQHRGEHYDLKQNWGGTNIKLAPGAPKTVNIYLSGMFTRPVKIYLSEKEIHSLIEVLNKYRKESFGTTYEVPCFFPDSGGHYRWFYEESDNKNLFVNHVKDPSYPIGFRWITLPIGLLERPEHNDVVAVRGSGPEFSSTNWISYSFSDLEKLSAVGI
jgi:hypothetical protein